MIREKKSIGNPGAAWLKSNGPMENIKEILWLLCVYKFMNFRKFRPRVEKFGGIWMEEGTRWSSDPFRWILFSWRDSKLTCLSRAKVYGHFAGGAGACTRLAVPQGSSICYWHAALCFAQKQAARPVYRDRGLWSPLRSSRGHLFKSYTCLQQNDNLASNRESTHNG